MNRVELHGGLTRDAELRQMDSGVALWTATLAVNGARWSSRESAQVVTTQYIAIQAWGWLAEELGQRNYRRGEELFVLGEIDQSEYEKADGTKESKTRVTVLMAHPTRRREAAAPVPMSEEQVPF